MHLKTHTLPSSWAGYLINEDLSFVTLQEQNECFKFLKEQDLDPSQLVSTSSRFYGMSHHNLKTQEVCIYAFSTK